MANIKAGLTFFNIDTDRYQDRRIKRLKKDCGCKGIAVYDYLLCEIYRVHGCFVEWDKNTVFDVAEYFNIEENSVKEIVQYCANVGLFDKALLSRGIITSAAIQRRYVEMCSRARRKAPIIPGDYKIVNKLDFNEDDNNQNNSNKIDIEVDALKNDDLWLDQLQVVHHIDKDKLKSFLDDFRLQCITDGKFYHSSITDAKKHFNAWLRIILSDNNDNIKSKRQNKRRGDILPSDEKKTYNSSF